MFKRITALALCLLLLLSATAVAEEFSLRGGVKFGMSPEEVIAIESSNGFKHDLTNDGELLYYSSDSDNYQLYYQDNPLGKMGKIPIFRFEYDFDATEQKMYQFYYVFDEEGACSYLSEALIAKYGMPSQHPATFTELYLSRGADSHLTHNCWTVESGEGKLVVIDIWDNSYGTCFLVYQQVDVTPRPLVNTLDFGL